MLRNVNSVLHTSNLFADFRRFTTMLTTKILVQRSLASKSVRNLLWLKHAFYLHLGLNTMTLVEKRIACPKLVNGI
ncbi:uncharacterized protein LOC131258082 isoform X4 [Magnolia sinica]|uniref:uncharacterized protein LOC131258082 isoform X4 n=1 Tax=Magnolia sinica TaxID=86752 RepID=UPI002658A09F|nr:uncharacterized protein LOC131258082 isoform X4 [Magnolia sinica]